MHPNPPFRIAVIGNPNCGKTSIFNLLTGLQQRVGNFPGVTVDRKSGFLSHHAGFRVEVVDLPGAYSLYPTSKDERLVVQTIVNPQDPDYPDAVLYVADITRLEKHLLLFTQVKDAGFPMILALNMADTAAEEGLEIDTSALSQKLECPVLLVSGRSGLGIDALRLAILAQAQHHPANAPDGSAFFRFSPEEARIAAELQTGFASLNHYQRILLTHHAEWLPHLSSMQRERIFQLRERTGFRELPLQVRETMQRFDRFTPLVHQSIRNTREKVNSLTEKLDDLLTHQIFGPFFFFLLMALLFQSIFSWATYPMDWIEGGIGQLSHWIKSTLPAGWFNDLLSDGVLAGLAGVLVFVPQIALLFFLISILEEVGYMARAVFMFDRVMQVFGLNGRSVVALISGGACAIPAIMSTRTIANWKERLITILVTPFISCSARIPVYTVLIAFVVPEKTVLGIFQLQGLAFLGLYLLGILAALGAALIFRFLLKSSDSSFLMLELPPYRLPLFRNVWMTVWGKIKAFTLEAGKIILLISIALWALSSYGPAEKMKKASAEAAQIATEQNLSAQDAQTIEASLRMEASYAGHAGRLMEPLIRPLGFDWKIGIALITSFAAREVFVGTMATLYSISDADDALRVREGMARERNPRTGKKVYDTPTSWALLIFYVFAMQCMSTLAVVRRETLSWKWPVIQFLFMTGLAYLSAWAIQLAF
ncbi:MAG: ferrous iron transport protein B [Haliscomenobacter sp.]